MTRLLIVSDFNAELLSRYLETDKSLTVETAPFGQVVPTLAGLASAEDGTVVVWTRPEGVCPSYDGALGGVPAALDDVLADVDAFADLVRAAAERARMVLVATWAPSRVGRGLGLLDWSRDGYARRVAQMNLRLAEALDGAKGVYLLDSQRWIDAARPARDSKYWYSIKSPYAEPVFKAAAADVKAALRAQAGLARKLLILDLDNTLWGGIVGDDGMENLRLGGHDAVGEAHADLQRAALALAKRGVALAVVSKNDEELALAAIDGHPEMLIRSKDLAGWRINWDDKAANILALVNELNLGLDAAVFLDDNPTERGRIREALPQVLVPDMPAHPAAYADVLRQLDVFDQAAVTDEDRARNEMYAADRSRRQSTTSFSSHADWLTSLEIRVGVAPLSPANLKRATQLLNKTNQMNLATRRLSETELETWARAPGHDLMTLTIADRFGDLGLTGLVSWRQASGELEIVDFVLSCRAFGREVERLMAALAVAAASRAGLPQVIARYSETAKNRPALEFWRKSGFGEPEPGLFVRAANEPYPSPGCIAVTAA